MRSTRAPAAEGLQKLRLQLCRHSLVGTAGQTDGRPHLREIALAPIAEDEMLLEALSVGRIQAVLQVRRHQFDDLPARKFSIKSHPRYSSRAPRTFARARWR